MAFAWHGNCWAGKVKFVAEEGVWWKERKKYIYSRIKV